LVGGSLFPALFFPFFFKQKPQKVFCLWEGLKRCGFFPKRVFFGRGNPPDGFHPPLWGVFFWAGVCFFSVCFPVLLGWETSFWGEVGGFFLVLFCPVRQFFGGVEPLGKGGGGIFREGGGGFPPFNNPLFFFFLVFFLPPGLVVVFCGGGWGFFVLFLLGGFGGDPPPPHPFFFFEATPTLSPFSPLDPHPNLIYFFGSHWLAFFF